MSTIRSRSVIEVEELQQVALTLSAATTLWITSISLILRKYTDCSESFATMEGTFGSDGELKKTGPSDVQTAHGLGGSNIKGVDDSKTRTDAEADTGKTVPDQHINSSNTYPRVGTDPASTWPATLSTHICITCMSFVPFICSNHQQF